MAQNKDPIFILTPKNSWVQLTAADGSQDGIDADVKLLFTADATNGSFLHKIIFQPISTSGSTTTNTAAGRIYLNNGSSVGTASNNTLIQERQLGAVAVNVSGTTYSQNFEVPLNLPLAAGYKIYIGITSFASNTAYQVTAFAGDY